VQDFYPFFYICIAIGDPIIKRGFWIPLTSLTLPHFCASPQPGQRYIVKTKSPENNNLQK
jgi:hypothetical protein